MRLRPLVATPLVLATLGLAACGGGGGGSEDDYTGAFNDACKNLVTARDTAGREAQALAPKLQKASEAEQAKGISTAYGKLAGSLADAFDDLKDAEAPDKWSDYQEKASKVFEQDAKGFRTAQASFEPGTVAGVTKGLQQLNAIAEPPKAPADLVKATSTCTSTGVTGVSTAATSGTADGTATAPSAGTATTTTPSSGSSSGTATGSSGSSSGTATTPSGGASSGTSTTP